ncbi:hypothetical protein [Massilia rubra]|uniref:hypothetical protein n=1 Tax=Massilia rubra TaxID=2607910 RepID=UPI001421DD80|nr:hypothetical protein [Massilia rubra]
MSMSADQVIAEYQSNGNAVSPAVATALLAPEVRRAIYKQLVGATLAPYRALLIELLDEEINLRTALWDHIVQDDMDYYEGIYQCAFLLYRAGDVADSLLLWKAKHINMDVGTLLGAEYFVGAGLDVTMAYLSNSPMPEAAELADYLQQWFEKPGAIAWQEAWEQERASAIANA